MSKLCLKVLVKVILNEARNAERGREWTFELQPKQMKQRQYRTDATEVPEMLSDPEEDSGFFGMFVDAYAILLASLDGDEQEVSRRVLECLETVAKVRTWLDSARKENFYLFFVGPLGSAETKEWRDIQYRLERDERICRKLVWLPQADEAHIERDAIGFCDRTIMARPWKDARREAAELDPLRIVLTAAQVPPVWYDVLETRSNSDKGIAEQLIAGLPDEDGST